MSLPTQKSEVENNLSQQIILVYGRPKIGKSTLCSCFPDALFIATEPGLNHLSIFKQNSTSWADFKGICKDLAEGKHNFKTVIIDTIDNLVMQCSQFICDREGINHPSDYDYGKGWSMVTKELQRVLSKIASMPFGLIMVGHSKTEEVKTKTKAYNKQTITVTGENRKVVLAMADIILFMESDLMDDKEIGIIRTKPSLYFDAGDRSKLLPETIEFPLDKPEEAYKKIKAKFK